ncbi:MAG: sigma-54-dependent Fis family transcriptional regulator [Acidobacteria bacterium]|nr:sigma-54-dependent Fis family transcriptional regulator [Acidobacteriota bacterium]
MHAKPGVESDRVLVVEDDAAQRVGLQQLIRSWGFAVEAASDGREALERIAAVEPTIVLSDLVMPRMDGLELLVNLRQEHPDITVVLMTAQGTVETAVSAIKQGAYDYLSKPIDPQRLKILLDQIVERHGTQREVRLLRRQLQERGTFGKMIGASAEIRKIYQLVEQAAPTVASVLISGESGTGKELVAQTIHQLSPRAMQPFVPLNCAAIPDTLLESELFGHEKGAFTGAFARRQGAFELANRGTLFLDEIAEMTPATQAKLLRVLQERSFRPLGGQREQTVDIRVIAATNVEPAEAVRQGKLREDLYYRLNVFAIRLPPLRERRGDIPLLVQAFLREFGDRNGKKLAGISDAAMQTLERHHWPGNVRELRNVMERATIVAKGDLIEPEDLPVFAPAVGAPASPAAGGGPGTAAFTGLTPGTTVDEAERRLIEVTLEHTGGNKTRAAEMLGISLKTLHNKLNRMKEEGAAQRE